MNKTYADSTWVPDERLVKFFGEGCGSGFSDIRRARDDLRRKWFSMTEEEIIHAIEEGRNGVPFF